MKRAERGDRLPADRGRGGWARGGAALRYFVEVKVASLEQGAELAGLGFDVAGIEPQELHGRLGRHAGRARGARGARLFGDGPAEQSCSSNRSPPCPTTPTPKSCPRS